MSPDEHWLWDGQQWVPNTQAPTDTTSVAVPAVPGGMAAAPKVSPDGRWRWDGQQWVPHTVLASGGLIQSGPMVVAPKNPAVHLVVSFFIPGVGSMMNGDVGIGVAILVIFIIGVGGSFFLIGLPVALGAWIWGLIDAYMGAQRWNRTHGILS